MSQIRDIRAKYLKTYELDNQGNAIVQRSFRFTNRGNSPSDLPRITCQLIEDSIHLCDFDYYDAEGPVEHEDPVVQQGTTELKAYTRPKLVNPGHDYTLSFKYKWPQFAHRTGSGWFAQDNFSLTSKMTQGVHWYIQYKLPPLKPIWKFWQSVKRDALRDGASGSYDQQKRAYSWEFGLQPNEMSTVTIFYVLLSREKLLALLSGIVGYLVNEVAKRVISWLVG